MGLAVGRQEGGLRRPPDGLPRRRAARSCCCRCWRSSWRRRCGDLPDLLRRQVVRDAIVITLETNIVANVLILAFGTPAAYLLGHPALPRPRVVLTLIELPLVLPPAVAGIGLLAAFGRSGCWATTSRRWASCCRSPRPRSCSRSCSSPARSTCARRSPRSRASTPTCRRRAHARRPPGPRVPAHRAAARPGRARRRRGPRLRPRHRGVRRDDHVRRQPPGRHADPAARDLRAVRGRLRRRRSRSAPCWWCSAPRSCSRRQAAPPRGLPSARDRDIPLRHFAVAPSSSCAPRRWPWSAPPAPARRRCCARSPASSPRTRAASRWATRAWFDAARRSTCAPEERSVGLVFQEYALFPHLSVRGNVAFGGARARRRAARALRHRAPGEGPAAGHSRAASASASRWRARSRATRRCCCSTSRSRRSTRTRATACAPSCASCCASSACPRCS